MGDTFCIEKADCLLKLVLAGHAEAEMVQAGAVFIEFIVRDGFAGPLNLDEFSPHISTRKGAWATRISNGSPLNSLNSAPSCVTRTPIRRPW
jgi:hypothetical protein